MLFTHTTLCVGLLWASFCRACHTSSASTRVSIRAAICVQAATALLAAAAPFLWGYAPSWPAVLLLASMLTMQAVTARQWRGGVPLSFQRAGYRRHG